MFMLAFILFCLYISGSFANHAEDEVCSNKFNCEYNVLRKLVLLEEITGRQETRIASLTEELKDAKDTIAELNETIVTNRESADGTTYIRWGRTTCPDTAFLVYDGYVAGSEHDHPGTAVNPLCLPRDPNYENYTEGFQASGRIYGAEYETSTYSKSSWSKLQDHDIPCAVCRIPRNNVLMVPGKNVCHENYMLEYKGYLMSSRYNHNAPSEFVCVDDHPETIPGTHASGNGKLFYFVEGQCGTLQCGPYKNGWELTCPVCSYLQVHSLRS